MSRIRGRDTFPELALRKALRRRGVRYRSNQRVHGIRVDLVLRGTKTLVMVQGCFWHGCPRHYIAPKSNSRFWKKKIVANRERDRWQAAILSAMGWQVVVLWEHALRTDPARAVERLITTAPLPCRAARQGDAGYLSDERGMEIR